MNKEVIEHRERLKVLEKHIGEYYYMIGNIHSGISDAMEEYHQAKLKLLGIADVNHRRELLFSYEKSFESENVSDADIYQTIDSFLSK